MTWLSSAHWRGVIFGVVMVGFVVSSAITMIAIGRNNRAVQELVTENVVWAATQLQVEAANFQHALMRLADAPGPVAVEDARLRLDLVWSRLEVLESGEAARFLAAHQLEASVTAVRGTLVQVDGLGTDLWQPDAPPFAGTLRRAIDLMEPQMGVLRAWSVQVLHADRDRFYSQVDEQAAATDWLRISYLGLVAVGCSAFVLLLREVRVGNRRAAEARAATEQAAAAERRLIDGITAIPEGFALYDQDDRLVAFNQRYREIYAHSAPAIKSGAKFEDILRYGAKRGQYAQAIGRIDEWVAERLAHHRAGTGSIEQEIAGNRWLRIEERPTSEGGVVGVRVDITDIKRAQQLLEQAEAATSLGHFTLDVSSGDLTTSANLDAVLGGEDYGPVAGWAGFLARIAPEDRAQVDHLVASILNGAEEAQGTVSTVLIGGRSRHVTLLLRPQSSGSRGPRALFGTVQDVTAQRDAERDLAAAKDEAQDANEAKSRFLSIMSHEIRTPMNGVTGSLGLIDTDELPPDQASLIALAQSSADRLGRVLNDILDFTRMESGRLSLDSAVFDPRALVQEATNFWKPTAQNKGMTVSCLIPAAVPERLVGDAGRWRQVLDNLVSNAIKYSDSGAVAIRLSVPEMSVADVPNSDGADPDDASVPIRLSVADQGRGIAPEDRHRVFVEFSQVKDSDATTAGGSGLGLAICRRLVELMNGRMDFDSVPGQGSVFWVVVPFGVAEHSATVTDKQVIRLEEAKDVSGTSVLVAEDNETNQIVLIETLKALGCTTHLVENGQEAVDAAVRDPVDIVLMDISMPVLDGVSATRAIRRQVGYHLPIIACTAYAMPEDRARFEAAGFDAVLTKPIGKTAVARVIADWRHRRAAASNEPGDGTTTQAVTDSITIRQETAPSVLDIAVLDGLRASLNAGVFERLCSRFRVDVMGCLQEISHPQPGSRDEIAAATHRLVGVAGTMGADALNQAADALHRANDAWTGDGPPPDSVVALAREVGEVGVATLARFDDLLDPKSIAVANG